MALDFTKVKQLLGVNLQVDHWSRSSELILLTSFKVIIYLSDVDVDVSQKVTNAQGRSDTCNREKQSFGTYKFVGRTVNVSSKVVKCWENDTL